MLRKLYTLLVAIPTVVVKLANWLMDPKNGSNFVTPLNRRYLSTGASLAVTVLYHAGAGVYNFFMNYVLGAAAYIVQGILNVVLDLWRANPSYSRWAARGAAMAAVLVATYGVLALKVTGSVTHTLLVGLYRTMR